MELELILAWVLWTGNLSGIGPSGLILAHGLCSALLGWALLSLLPPRYQSPPIPSWFFLFAVAFFIPVIGSLGLMAAFLPATIWPQRVQALGPVVWQHATEPQLLRESSKASLDLSGREAWISSILQHSTDAGKRLMAVLATTKLLNRDAIPLLRLALQDSEDDVRLLAYALLDRKEYSISYHIESQEQLLENATADRKATLHQSIAQNCWELVQLQLAQNEIEAHLLKKAQEHLEAALILMPKRAGLYFLQGQISLRQDDLDEAVSAFRHAEQFGIDRSQIETYLAEIHFLRKNLMLLKRAAGQI